MILTTKDIRMKMLEKEISLTEVAKRTNHTVQNLHYKFKKEDFKMSELKAIADALSCELVIELRNKKEETAINNE